MSSEATGIRLVLERICAACERFTESKKRCLVFAFVFALVVIVAGSMAWYPVDANDDFYMAMALSGVWGQGEGLCLFMNALTSQLIFFLNTALPFGNWYAWLELITAFFSLFTVTYLALTRVSLPFASLVITATLAFTIAGCTWEANFTFVSVASICAGGMALLASVREERHRPSLIVVGVAFMCIGYLWRYEVFILCIPAFGIAALVYLLFEERRRQGAIKSLLRLWPFALVLCLVGASYAYDCQVWQQDPWRDWADFNNARSVLFDYPLKGYDEIADELGALGVSENDYDMLDLSITDDPDFFTTELLEQVTEVATIDLFTPHRFAVALRNYFTRTFIDPVFLTILALALVVTIATTRGRVRKTILALLGLSLVLSIIFAVIGRIPHRVHYPIWLFSIVAACLFTPRGSARQSARAGDEVLRAGALHSAAGSVATAGFAAVTAAVLIFSVVNFSPARAEATYAPRTFEPDSVVTRYVDEHPDEVFLFRAAKDIRFAYMLRALPDHDMAYRMPSFGGWVSRAPYREAANRQFGVTNMMKDLVENDSVRLVWRGSDPPDVLLTYLREHYYPNCTYELVDKVKSDTTAVTLHIYKFHKGEA